MPTWPFGDLRPLHYGAIYADPAWLFKLRSKKGEAKSPQAHYRCMPLKEIQALPVGHLAAPDCLLVMWATFPMLPQAIETLQLWGFQYKTGGSWAKRSRTGKKWAFGPGYIVRSASEVWLIGTIGSPRIKSKSIRNLLVDPIREHSRKPESGWQMVEKLADGPYCELFGRGQRPGWDVWGNETEKFTAAAPVAA